VSIDLERARRETLGCENVLHFNNAGAALMPSPVLEVIINHLQLEVHTGGYEAAKQANSQIERIYQALATLLNCGADEIAIVENATRAWDMAYYSIPFKSGDRILTSQAEYSSNYIAHLQVARKTGAVIEVISNDENGQISIEALRKAIDERTKLIALTHVPTSGGLVSPAAEVGKVAREAGVLYLLDACQSVGQMPLDVETIGCDFLSATGRKFLRGPRGTGFLYVRRTILEQLEPPFLDLHAAEWTAKNEYTIRPDARRFENWETNYSTKIGLAVAVDYALSWGLAEIKERVQALAQTLRDQLAVISGVTVHDVGAEKCGIVTFQVAGKDSTEVQSWLEERKINTSVSAMNYARLDLEERGLKSLVRASVHYYNSEEEIARFCETLARF